MKIITMDLDSIVLFLSDMDFSLEEDIDVLEEKFRGIFLHLKNLYDIEVEGFYKIDIYKDKYFGMIVDIEKEDFDYFEYLDNQVDMRISIHEDNLILYEFEDYFSLSPSLLQKMNLYVYQNKVYGEIKDFISKLEGAYLQEHISSVVYGSITKYILQKKNNIEKTNLL